MPFHFNLFNYFLKPNLNNVNRVIVDKYTRMKNENELLKRKLQESENQKNIEDSTVDINQTKINKYFEMRWM